MGRTPVFVMAAFLAGLGIGLFARSAVLAAPQQADTRAADLVAIEKLHRADEECTLSQDPACLTVLWSDNGVKVDAPGGPLVGIKALGEMYAKARAQPGAALARFLDKLNSAAPIILVPLRTQKQNS